MMIDDNLYHFRDLKSFLFIALFSAGGLISLIMIVPSFNIELKIRWTEEDGHNHMKSETCQQEVRKRLPDFLIVGVKKSGTMILGKQLYFK